MDLFFFVVFASIFLPESEAMPLSDGISIVLPGVSIKRIVKELSSDNIRPIVPPLQVGNENSQISEVSISFGGGGGGVQDKPAAKVTMMPLNLVNGSEDVSVTIPIETSGLLSMIQFPSRTNNSSSLVKLNPGEVNDGHQSGSGHIIFPGTTNVIGNNNPSFSNRVESSNRECDLSSGAIQVNGTCMRFLARNVCPEGEWFVKVDDDEVGGQCVPRPCPSGQLLFEDECISPSNETACSYGQILYVDFSGYVHCDCQPNFIYDPRFGHCFAQGDRGFCNFGEQTIIGDDDSIRCERNVCGMEGFIFHNTSGWCYRKMFKGFCSEDLLVVHRNNGTAECSALDIKSIFDLPTLRSCVGGSVRDYAGKCREEFRVPAVSTSPIFYGDCPFGFSKDTQDTCRKTHRLFG